MPVRETVVGRLEEPAEIDDGISETESEELSEPKFKYKRILNDTSKVFEQDAASCLAVHEKFLAVGTQRGCVYVMDHMGNVLPYKSLNQHTAAVNQISIDGSGDYLISCSNDGKVIVYGLASGEYNQALSMNRPIRSAAIANDFSKSSSGQQFATGDRTLVLHERTFFSSDKQTVVFAGKDRDGFIQTICWRGPLIAFTNDTGTRVYDRTLRTLITHVVRKHDLSLRSELYPPRLCWLSDSSFVIAWANTVTVCGVRVNTNPASIDLPSKLVEIRHMLDLPDHFVAGVSFTSSVDDVTTSEENWKELVLFCVCKPADEQAATGTPVTEPEDTVEKSWLPRVWLVEPTGFNDFDLITEDIIEMRDSEKLLAHHYHLTGIPADSLYFLVGSRDMIEVRPCSADDHVDWLLKNGLYGKALEFAKQHADSLETTTPHDVGRQLLDALIDEEEYEEAARMCPEICGKRKDVWETYVTRFDERKKLRVLAPVLPVKVPQLEPECYEMVLKEFLSGDVDGFRRLVREWSPDLYRVGGLITHTLERLYRKNLDRETHNSLLCTLGQLYTYERNYERALAIYMNLGDRAVFQLIERYRLFPLVKDKIRELMDIDTDLSVRLLLENEESLPAATVMRQLTKQPRLQLAYLDRLFSRNEGIEFADQAVTLYAEHDTKRLLPYLRRYAEHYNIDKALETCRRKGLMEELVFLLGRGGNQREALKVIIDDQKRMDKAIDFCKEHDDADLWNDLITFAVKKPEYITELMRNIGTYVDPTIIIRRIPPAMKIPGLRDSLVKTLQDYALQISMQEGCRRVTLGDVHELLDRLMRLQTRGVYVGANANCVACRKPLLSEDVRYAVDAVIFFCGHFSHGFCDDRLFACPICAPKRAR